MTFGEHAKAYKGTGAARWQRPAFVDLLPPCKNACPAGLKYPVPLGIWTMASTWSVGASTTTVGEEHASSSVTLSGVM